jgi:hypothetical protein
LTNNRKDYTKLEKFSRLYECARLAYEETLEGLDRNLRQYRGSSEIDGGIENANAVRNITYELIESAISAEIPYAKVEAESYSEKGEMLSQAVERLLYTARERLPLDEINDSDERCTYVFGGSILFLEWVNDEEGGDGEVRLRHISPRDFIPEPGIMRLEDMSYCFLKFTTNKGELTSKYHIKKDDLKLAELGFRWGEAASMDDTVNVIFAFYKGDDGRVGRFVFSGDLVLSDEPDYYGSYLGDNVDFAGESEEYENISLQNAEDYKESVKVKRYRPKEFPLVLRRNISSEGDLLGASDADILRPIQQAINKVESRIMQKLLRAGVTPIMPEDASVSLSNAVFGQVIKIKAGESASQYGTVDTTPDISQDIAEADRLYDQAKRLVGISDAYQGIDLNKVESGYAKSLRIRQAEGRLESKRRMKNIAYEQLYKLIFQHYLAFSKSTRSLVYKDGFGVVRDQRFDKRDFIQMNEAGEYYYFDKLVFSVDTDLFEEYQREAVWERNLENLKSGTLGDPENPATLLRYWQFQQRAHYPNAKENVEYFKKIVEKEREKESE